MVDDLATTELALTSLPTRHRYQPMLWLLDFAASSVDEATLAKGLSADECARMKRISTGKDRRRFGMTRWALRKLLGNASGQPARSIGFGENAHGKPIVANAADLHFPDLHFNVSHSGDLALIGISQTGPLGVDIEVVRPEIDLADLIELFFTPSEHVLIAANSAAQQRSAFYSIWTAKEAVLKAWGLGITDHLKDFSVEPHGGHFVLKPESPEGNVVTQGLTAHAVGVPAGYAAACAQWHP
jgi:4'-phosphopantetheinyl transferase